MAPPDDGRVDAIASAIASGPRRRILERLAEQPATMTELADLLALTMAATTKHLTILVDAGLVRRSKAGRVVTFTLVPRSLEPLQDWALSARLLWAASLDRMATHLDSLAPSQDHTKDADTKGNPS